MSMSMVCLAMGIAFMASSVLAVYHKSLTRACGWMALAVVLLLLALFKGFQG